ncbi:MAG: hypothetical protein U0X58_00815 [Flavobacteriaceae bacterium]
MSMSTGEGAEEMVEDMPGVGHAIIHEHEEAAEGFGGFDVRIGCGVNCWYLGRKQENLLGANGLLIWF